MNKCFFSIALLLVTNAVIAQKLRFDTTVKIGKVGYRLVSQNKNLQKNQLSISLIGFDTNGNSDIDWPIKGRVVGSEIDDLNRDGYPDVLVYIRTDEVKHNIQVMALASEENKRLAPIILPDIMEDAKLRQGYDGRDTFRLMNGLLLRKFPITIKEENSSRVFTTVRHIYYTVVKGEGRGWLFKVMRNYDLMKEE